MKKIIDHRGSLTFEEFVDLCIRESTQGASPSGAESTPGAYVTEDQFREFEARHTRLIRSMMDMWLSYWLDFGA